MTVPRGTPLAAGLDVAAELPTCLETYPYTATISDGTGHLHSSFVGSSVPIDRDAVSDTAADAGAAAHQRCDFAYLFMW